MLETTSPHCTLSNVGSLLSKMDELQANVNYMHEYRQACETRRELSAEPTGTRIFSRVRRA